MSEPTNIPPPEAWGDPPPRDTIIYAIQQWVPVFTGGLTDTRDPETPWEWHDFTVYHRSLAEAQASAERDGLDPRRHRIIRRSSAVRETEYRL